MANKIRKIRLYISLIRRFNIMYIAFYVVNLLFKMYILSTIDKLFT